jgi:hypothetical protein
MNVVDFETWPQRITGRLIPLLSKEGVAAPLKNGPVPKRRGRGGRSRVTLRKAFLKHWRVSDHPVCAASVASRLFIDAAATPPHEEGNAPTTEQFGSS